MKLPTIKARFVLDKQGKPMGKSGHYSIALTIDSAPKDTHKVTYQLDPTYYDPLREVRDKKTNFSEELTSYGDYLIQAKVRTKDHSISTSRSLYDALLESHGHDPSPEVVRALNAIKEN